MSATFTKLPKTATKAIKPFKAAIADEKLQELKQLLDASKIGKDTYETVQQDRKYGITSSWLRDAKEQ